MWFLFWADLFDYGYDWLTDVGDPYCEDEVG